MGATEQLTAEVRDQNGNAMAGAAVSWASNAAAVATVSNSGLATAAGNGTATITATAGSASGSATVTVAQEVSAVAVSPATDTLRLAAEAADSNGHPVVRAEFDWASSDTLVAVVDDADLATGVGAGEAEVAATAAGVTGRALLVVVAPAPRTIAVTPDAVALTALGQTAQLAAEVRDQHGHEMAQAGVAWSSSDVSVASVDPSDMTPDVVCSRPCGTTR